MQILIVVCSLLQFVLNKKHNLQYIYPLELFLIYMSIRAHYRQLSQIMTIKMQLGIANPALVRTSIGFCLNSGWLVLA